MSSRDASLVKIGTGIGAGIIVRGEIHRGAQGCAGDIGHIQIAADREVTCRCGNANCLEALAGGAALARDGEAAAREGGSPFLRALLEEKGSIEAADVARGAAHGDAVSLELIANAGRLVGQAVAAIVNFFDPSHRRHRRRCRRRRWRAVGHHPANRVPAARCRSRPATSAFHRSALRDRVGVVGAATMGRERAVRRRRSSPAGSMRALLSRRGLSRFRSPSVRAWRVRGRRGAAGRGRGRACAGAPRVKPDPGYRLLFDGTRRASPGGPTQAPGLRAEGGLHAARRQAGSACSGTTTSRSSADDAQGRVDDCRATRTPVSSSASPRRQRPVGGRRAELRGPDRSDRRPRLDDWRDLQLPGRQQGSSATRRSTRRASGTLRAHGRRPAVVVRLNGASSTASSRRARRGEPRPRLRWPPEPQ